MLISIEGPDFVGKNTIIQKIRDYNKTKKIKIISFPNNETEIGQMCRKMLKDTTEWSKARSAIFQLLNTAHRYEYYEELKRAKRSPDEFLFIIRYNLSGPVYASIDGIDATRTWQLYDWFDDCLPDMTFILFREYEYEILKKEREIEHYETEYKQKLVKDIYKLAPILWKERLGSTHIIVNKNVEETVSKIFSLVNGNSL